MLETQSKRILESEARKFYKKYSTAILDIILFGSVVKGKEKPNDLDILLVFKQEKDNNIAYEFRKLLEKRITIPIDITTKEYFELFKDTFQAKEAILTEGYSLLAKTKISKGLGYKNLIMFIYELKGKTNSERMRFYYSLYGRGSKGMLEELKSKKYTDKIILCPVEYKEKMKEYLDSWKIEFNELPVLIPLRLSK